MMKKTISILFFIFVGNLNAATLYLCKTYSGGLFWYSQTCSNAQSLIERMVNVPDNLPFEQQVNIGEQNLAQARKIITDRNSNNYTVQNNTNQDKKNYCISIAQQIINIDNQARLAQSSQMQNYLNNKKRELRDTQYRSNCK